MEGKGLCIPLLAQQGRKTQNNDRLTALYPGPADNPGKLAPELLQTLTHDTTLACLGGTVGSVAVRAA